MTLAQKNLRSLRIIHIAFLFAAVAYLAVPFLAPPSGSQPPPAAVVIGISVVGFSTWAAGIFIRTRMVQPAEDVLRNNPEDAAAVGRWRMGVILSLVFCESVVLFGLALRFVGASWNVCGVFYGVGIFFLLAWTPRLELPAA
jgi:F0F1-type ATP synthase membrane subunit c/vacuolar-type H+-ATPase subunit K